MFIEKFQSSRSALIRLQAVKSLCIILLKVLKNSNKISHLIKFTEVILQCLADNDINPLDRFSDIMTVIK